MEPPPPLTLLPLVQAAPGRLVARERGRAALLLVAVAQAVPLVRRRPVARDLALGLLAVLALEAARARLARRLVLERAARTLAMARERRRRAAAPSGKRLLVKSNSSCPKGSSSTRG